MMAVVVAPVLQMYVPPPDAVKVRLLPMFIVVPPPVVAMAAVGGVVLEFTVTLDVAVHPFTLSVTVTV